LASRRGLKLDFAFRQNAEFLNGGLLPCAANDAESVHDEGRVKNECDDGKNDAKYLPDPSRDLARVVEMRMPRSIWRSRPPSKGKAGARFWNIKSIFAPAIDIRSGIF
jgi:hypothetical protein